MVRQIHIEEDRFGVEPELTAKVAKMRLRIYEVPIGYRRRTYLEGKEIGWKRRRPRDLRDLEVRHTPTVKFVTARARSI